LCSLDEPWHRARPLRLWRSNLATEDQALERTRRHSLLLV
jgi:hypothetical protein